MLRGLVVTIVAALAVGTLSAQSPEQMVVASDTVTYRYTPIDQTSRAQTGIERFGLRLNDYLGFAEDDPRDVKFMAIGGPAYSESTGWRLSALATLYYRTKVSPLHHSVRFGGMASLRGCFGASIDGISHFAERHTISYGGSFALDRRYLYGLDYATALSDDRGEYRLRSYGAYLSYDFEVVPLLTLGLRSEYQMCEVVGADAFVCDMIAGREHIFSAFDIGIGIRYSSRHTEDINLTRGGVVEAEYSISPGVLNSVGEELHEVSLLLDWYQPLWRGGLLALDAYGEYHSANTPWMCRAMLGGDDRMRGYYYGRYSGNTLATAQLELRQRVWEGLVVVGWGGCGTAFSKDDSAAWSRVLPTYGGGIRWYFNPTSLVRFDCGFGRHSHAFIVGYTEAF